MNHRFAKFAVLVLALLAIPSLTQVANGQNGPDAAQAAAMDTDMEKAPTACIDTGNLERAVNTGYKKSVAAGRLLEAYELCLAFDKAKALRASMPELFSQPPYANNRWAVQCTETPDVLKRAFDAGYELYGVSMRMAKFYMNCGRTYDAGVMVDKAVVVSLDAPYGKAEYFNPAIELLRKNAVLRVRLDQLNEAARDYTNYLIYLDIIEDDKTSRRISDAIDEGRAILSRMASSGTTVSWAETLQKKVDTMAARRNDAIATRERERVETARAEQQHAENCAKLPGYITAVTDRTNAATASTSVELYVQNMSSACKSYRHYQDFVMENKCGMDIYEQIGRLADNAHSLAKEAADNWEKEYLEHISVECY